MQQKKIKIEQDTTTTAEMQETIDNAGPAGGRAGTEVLILGGGYPKKAEKKRGGVLALKCRQRKVDTISSGELGSLEQSLMHLKKFH